MHSIIKKKHQNCFKKLELLGTEELLPQTLCLWNAPSWHLNCGLPGWASGFPSKPHFFDSDEIFQRAARAGDAPPLQTSYIGSLHVWQISCRKPITQKAESQTQDADHLSEEQPSPLVWGGKRCEISPAQNLHTVPMGSRPDVRACACQCGRMWALVLSLRGQQTGWQRRR